MENRFRRDRPQREGHAAGGHRVPRSGTGGGWLPVPQVVPGVVDRLFQPLTVESLLMSGQATGNTCDTPLKARPRPQRAGVAEDGTKPESTLAYSTLEEPIRIATTLSVSDELLEDAPAIQSFISGRLGLFAKIEAERQLLRGTSGGNEVRGLLTSRGSPVYAGGTAAGNRAVQVFKVMTGMRGSAFVEPDWVIMSPANYEITRLLTDTPAGSTAADRSSGATVAHRRSARTASSPACRTCCGASRCMSPRRSGRAPHWSPPERGATVWNRGGLSVEASNSHASYFMTDLVALRAERRLGLTVLRPSAYIEVRLA